MVGLRRLGLASSTAAIVFVISAPSIAATTKDQCVDANAKGQDLRRDGKLAGAREQLRVCADAACPAMIRDDCTRRLDELESAQPSLVFDVKDAAGVDLIEVRLSVDGQPLGDRLDGTALRIDPGAHVFTFEAAGRPPVTEQLLIREGEAGRHEHVVLGQVVAPPSSDLAQQEGASAGLGARKVIGITLAGVGLAGLGVGTVFGLLAVSAWGSAKDACGGDPSQCRGDAAKGRSYRDTTNTDGMISTVGFIAGGALVAAGGIVFFTGSQHNESRSARVVVAPRLGPGQVGVALSGTF